MEEKTKVLIVDDSVLVRELLTEILSRDSRLEVVGAAEDPYVARNKIKELSPDVITLDIEMPKMDGIAFLKNIMRLRPMPVVMISTLTEAGAPKTLEALSLGAVDYVAKPKNSVQELSKLAEEIVEKVIMASKANLKPFDHTGDLDSLSVRSSLSEKVKKRKVKLDHVIAIGASTGGTEAIKDVLVQLPNHMPPIVVTQHIPPQFSTSFASRMDRLCELNVYEAQNNQVLRPGCVYIAPGSDHLKIIKQDIQFLCKLDQGAPVNRHRPAVDVLFDSVAETCGRRAIGVLLTGMGADGAYGLLRMYENGCHTIAQDEATSVVWGMPAAAVKLGAASQVLPLGRIASVLCDKTTRGGNNECASS